jgi:hypothetical protein
LWVIEFEVAVYLVRRDVVESNVVPAHRFEQRVSTDEVRIDERRRVNRPGFHAVFVLAASPVGEPVL